MSANVCRSEIKTAKKELKRRAVLRGTACPAPSTSIHDRVAQTGCLRAWRSSPWGRDRRALTTCCVGLPQPATTRGCCCWKVAGWKDPTASLYEMGDALCDERFALRCMSKCQQSVQHPFAARPATLRKGNGSEPRSFIEVCFMNEFC